MPIQILIWDTDEEKPNTSSKILLWQELSETKNSISIPNLVEKNSEQLKKIYLSLIISIVIGNIFDEPSLFLNCILYFCPFSPVI